MSACNIGEIVRSPTSGDGTTEKYQVAGMAWVDNWPISAER
jgi:hypothetical protein